MFCNEHDMTTCSFDIPKESCVAFNVDILVKSKPTHFATSLIGEESQHCKSYCNGMDNSTLLVFKRAICQGVLGYSVHL